MNIKRAKQEIIHAIQAYLLKDEYGDYVIPAVYQRPILLLGAPGIGKTRIMEQIAAECGIALVAYTITHHTRQSAIGLPFISQESFRGKTYTATEYTMSEIVASLYQKMEKTGLFEGLLFIDEINCVSETLAPAMLQFLQGKSFGNHQIPEGWIIVAAGNPPEYNKSVRDFDVVTLDRIRKIEVEPDFDVWKEYAWQTGIHAAVLSYLNTRPLHFYRMETTVDGRFFATPRGWEDLSRVLQVYEQLSLPTDREVVEQYIQHPEIAADFAGYLELFAKYQTDYQIDEIFRGNIPDILLKKVTHASFDERLSIVGLLLARCATGFQEYCRKEENLVLLHRQLAEIKEPMLHDTNGRPEHLAEERRNLLRDERLRKEKAELLTESEKKSCLYAESFLEKAILQLRGTEGDLDGKQAFALVKDLFMIEQEDYDQAYTAAGQKLEYAFDFLESAFSRGQELVLFLTELNSSPYSLRFLKRYECERYYFYNKELLYEERSQAILRKIEALL